MFYEHDINMNMNEQDTLKTALKKLELNTDIKATNLQLQKPQAKFDALIKLDGIKLITEVKRNILRTNIGTIINQLKDLKHDGDTLLVGNYINDRLGELLREAEINYIDTVGNAYLKKKPLLVLIKGNPKPKNTTQPVDQAFTPNGLKIVYALLTQPRLAAKGTQRDIADQADIALGAVGPIIKDLIKKGYLNERIKTKERYWNKDQIWTLIEKWVEAYPKLRKKQFIGRYVTYDNQWWKAKGLNLRKYGAVLGGEIAAEQYTRYLKPEVGTVYLDVLKKNEFLKDLRLVNAKTEYDTGGAIEIVAKFWKKNELNNQFETLTHPLITYADLIATADVRNIETANIIKENNIQKMVEEMTNAH